MKKILTAILICFTITPAFADDVIHPKAKNLREFFQYMGEYMQTEQGQHTTQQLGGALIGDPLTRGRYYQNLERQQMIQNGINPNYVAPYSQVSRNKMINCTPDGQGGFNCMEF